MTRRYSPRIMNNLMATWNRATAEDRRVGLAWYGDGNRFAQGLTRYGVSLAASCGVIAALSPGRNWTMNKKDAEEFLREFATGARGRRLPKVGSYGSRNLRKAEKCALGVEPLEVLGGKKVRNFYSGLLNPTSDSACCIDRHAKCAAFGKYLTDRTSVVRPAEYEWLQRHYVLGARRVLVLPSQFQAVIWVTWRRLSGVLAQEDLLFSEIGEQL